MKAYCRILCLGILVLSAGCGSEVASEVASDERPEARPEDEVADPVPPALAGMTADHNQVRAGVSPAAEPPLAPLTWSSDVAQTAQAWASQCRFEHNPNRGQLGENLAAFTDTSGSAQKAVAQWASEAADYDYATNSCAAGKTCGHYTQIVWRGAQILGCGVQDCATGSPFPGFLNWQFFVCDYSPPGNVIGQRPYLCDGQVCQ